MFGYRPELQRGKSFKRQSAVVGPGFEPAVMTFRTALFRGALCAASWPELSGMASKLLAAAARSRARAAWGSLVLQTFEIDGWNCASGRTGWTRREL